MHGARPAFGAIPSIRNTEGGGVVVSARRNEPLSGGHDGVSTDGYSPGMSDVTPDPEPQPPEPPSEPEPPATEPPEEQAGE